jgi:hypothetical protein
MQEVEIHVNNNLDSEWSDWFDEMEIKRVSAEEIVIQGILPDRSALYGVISRMSSLGLKLISVQTREVENENQKIKQSKSQTYK